MRTIRFKNLSIKDWRGQTREVAFSQHTAISGRNKSGKSTIWDAIMWLFTGYDSCDRSNYQLFDNRVVPTKENSIPASITLVYEEDGIEYKLSRIAQMGWTRPRGKDYYEKKSSDDYSFQIDGVDVTASAFKEFVEKHFCETEKLKFMLNTDYYLMLDWKTLRKHFADIIGEVERSEYVGNLDKAFRLIDRYGTSDAAKEYLLQQRKPLREAIGDNNAKGTKIVEVETLKSTLPDISNYDKALAEMEAIRQKVSEIDEKIAGRADSVKPYIEARNKELAVIAEMETSVNNSRIEYNRKAKASAKEIEAEISSIDFDNEQIERKNRTAARAIEDARRGLESAKSRLERCQQYRETLLEKNHEVKARQFSAEKCPYCGQELPEEKLESLRIKFEQEKDAEHKRIVADGKANNADMERYKAEIAECQSVIDAGFTPTPLRDKSELEAKLADFKASFVPYEETAEYKQKMAEIAEKKANITQIPSVSTEDLKAEKERLYHRQSELSETISLKKVYDSRMARIDALREDIRRTAGSLASIEGLIAQIDEIERQKAEIVRKRISYLFRICNIEMEERKKDGTMTPCCNIIINGVKAQVTNTADKMIAGMDIAAGFAKHFGLSMPIIVDNAERMDSVSLGFLDGLDTQSITMSVANHQLNIESYD